MKKNHYEILGVSKSASEEEIITAYKNAIRSGGDIDKTTEINEAFDILNNKKERAEYDLILRKYKNIEKKSVEEKLKVEKKTIERKPKVEEKPVEKKTKAEDKAIVIEPKVEDKPVDIKAEGRDKRESNNGLFDLIIFALMVLSYFVFGKKGIVFDVLLLIYSWILDIDKRVVIMNFITIFAGGLYGFVGVVLSFVALPKKIDKDNFGFVVNFLILANTFRMTFDFKTLVTITVIFLWMLGVKQEYSMLRKSKAFMITLIVVELWLSKYGIIVNVLGIWISFSCAFGLFKEY